MTNICVFVSLFCLSLFEVCFDQYDLDYLGRIKFLHVEIPYIYIHLSYLAVILPLLESGIILKAEVREQGSKGTDCSP